MKNYIKITGLILLNLASLQLFAQINPLDAQYFQNKYIANPAFAGEIDGSRVTLGYRSQWSNIQGAPENQNLTFDTKLNSVGIGLNFANETAGDMRQTKFVATYAYHLSLTENAQLHFGLSLGLQKGHYNNQNLIGDANDPILAAYNQRKTIFDGDFGVAFTNKRITVDAAFYNLKNQVKEWDENFADYHLYYVAASYLLPETNLNAKVAYRGVRNYSNILDVGFELKTNNQKLGFTSLYHTNKSYSFGVNYMHNQKWTFASYYNTVAKPISNYANGSFEVSLQINLHKLKN